MAIAAALVGLLFWGGFIITLVVDFVSSRVRARKYYLKYTGDPGTFWNPTKKTK